MGWVYRLLLGMLGGGLAAAIMAWPLLLHPAQSDLAQHPDLDDRAGFALMVAQAGSVIAIIGGAILGGLITTLLGFLAKRSASSRAQ